MNILILCAAVLIAAGSTDSVRIDRIDFVPHTLEAGDGESRVVSADLDNDGDHDLIVSSGSDHSVTVFLQEKDEQLTSLGSFPAGQNPDWLSAADINGDSFVDLVVANHETTYLSLLLGDGHGNLKLAYNSPLQIDVSPHPHAVAVRDLDADGHADIVVDHRTGHGVLVLKGLGRGAFKTPGTIVDVGGDPYLGMAIGDVNNDGRLDIVTPNPDGIGVILNTGLRDIGFAKPSRLVMPSPFAVGLTDLNGDGDLDLIAASDGRQTRAEIMLGNGQGEFQSANNWVFPVSAGAKTIAVGDINGDGISDAAISSWNSDVLIILGSVNEFQTVRLKYTGTPWGLAIADLNDDGKGDLVISDGIQPKVTVYFSQAR
ncbi:MAG: FG-GAP repeat domain-containing protein [Woeseiaceae bacterium]